MKRKAVAAALIAVALGAGAFGFIATSYGQTGTPKRSQGQDMQGMGGMMGPGMMGQGMMSGCQSMTGGHTAGNAAMPQLPPGNEKLQLQMQAEIMQKIGEITAKYAGQIK